MGQVNAIPVPLGNVVSQVAAAIGGQLATVAVASAGGNASATVVTPTGGTAARTLAARIADGLNAKDIGAVGDGSTDDTAAILAATAAGLGNLPAGIYKTTLQDSNTVNFSGKFSGSGQVLTANGTPRAPFFSGLTSAPSASIGSGSGPFGWGAAFGSDISHVQFPVEHHVSGAATLGQPTSGFLWTPEASPYLTWFVNSSGWNNSTNSNAGRTGVAIFRTVGTHLGQGDVVGTSVALECQSNMATATSFLASPACTIHDGQVTTTVDGVYMVGTEFDLDAGTHDVAAIGSVLNLLRRNSTGALGATWIGQRIQSQGTQPIDAFWSASGPAKVGIDFTTAALTTNQAAVTLAANQRVYLNAVNTPDGHSGGAFPNGTNPGNIWVEYDSATSKVVIGNGTTRLFSIDPTTGNVIAKGTLTGNGTP